MSRTFLNQTTQIGNSETYDDTLASGQDLEFSGSSESVQDDLNALRSMIRTAMGTAHWYVTASNSIAGIEQGKLYNGYDTMSGILDMGSNVITSVPMPDSDNDIATVEYISTVAGAIPVRAYRSFSRVTVSVSAGDDLVYPTNLDNSLPTFSAAIFDSDYDIFMNGQILRPGVEHDVYIGGSGDNESSLKLTFDALEGDVICTTYYAAPGYGGGDGGGGGGGGGTVTGIINFHQESEGVSLVAIDGYSIAVGDTVTFDSQTYTVISKNAAINAGGNFVQVAKLSGLFNPVPSVGVDSATVTISSSSGTNSNIISYTLIGEVSSIEIDGYTPAIGDIIYFYDGNQSLTVTSASGSVATLSGQYSSEPVPGVDSVYPYPVGSGNIYGYTLKDGNSTIFLNGLTASIGDTVSFGSQSLDVIVAGLESQSQLFGSTGYELNGVFSPLPVAGVDSVTVAPAPDYYNYTVSYYGIDPVNGVNTVLGFSNGVSSNITLPGYDRLNSTVTINDETVTLDNLSSGEDGARYYSFTSAFTVTPSVGDSAVYTI